MFICLKSQVYLCAYFWSHVLLGIHQMDLISCLNWTSGSMQTPSWRGQRICGGFYWKKSVVFSDLHASQSKSQGISVLHIWRLWLCSRVLPHCKFSFNIQLRLNSACKISIDNHTWISFTICSGADGHFPPTPSPLCYNILMHAF